MLKEYVLKLMRDMCKDMDEYTDCLNSLMDEYKVNNLQDITYDEMCDYYKRKLNTENIN